MPWQVVASKCDTVRGGGVEVEKKLAELRGVVDGSVGGEEGGGVVGALGLGEIIAVAGVGDGKKNDRVKGANMRGVAELQWSVLRAVGLEGYAMRLWGRWDDKTQRYKSEASTKQQDATLPSEHDRHGQHVGGMAELLSMAQQQIRERKLNAA